MHIERDKNGVFFTVIGARHTSQGITKAQTFTLGTNKATAERRAKLIYKLWLTQIDGIWTLEAYRRAKQLANEEMK
jgi:hypothetical protein